jgi:hypothetical protein
MAEMARRATHQHQHRPSGRHQRKSGKHTAAERLAMQAPPEQSGEDGLEIQQQRRAHCADSLETPGKTSGRHGASDERDGHETPHMLTSNRSFALRRTAEERKRRQSRTGIEKDGGRQRPRIDSRSLNDGGRDPEKDGGQDGQRRALGDGIHGACLKAFEARTSPTRLRRTNRP